MLSALGASLYGTVAGLEAAGSEREHAHLATWHALVGFVVLCLALLVSAAAMLPKKRWGIVVRWFGRLTLVCGILSSILGALQVEQLYGENEQVEVVELVLGAILVFVACLANVCGRNEEPDEARLGYLGSRYMISVQEQGEGLGRAEGLRPSRSVPPPPAARTWLATPLGERVRRSLKSVNAALRRSLGSAFPSRFAADDAKVEVANNPAAREQSVGETDLVDVPPPPRPQPQSTQRQREYEQAALRRNTVAPISIDV